MKFFQIVNFYGQYLKDFYRKNPGLEKQSHGEIYRRLMEDGFNAVHHYAEEMTKFGYQARLVVANDPVSQDAWAREHRAGLRLPPGPGPVVGAYGRFLDAFRFRILQEQIQSFRPDVLYLDDPVAFDDRFIRLLQPRPKLVIGWRAASIPRDCRWKLIDGMISNHEPSLPTARQRGVAYTATMQPGFVPGLCRPAENPSRGVDVIFAGSLSGEHTERLRILNGLATRWEEFSGKEFKIYGAPESQDCACAKFCRPAIWGSDMYGAIRSARINLNIHIDLAGSQAGNMRMFEVTGMGGFLLTDFKPNLEQFFIPGREIETFTGLEECIQKIRHYLQHEEERLAVAKAGQAKCLSTFTRGKSAARLDEIIREWSALKKVEPTKGILRGVGKLLGLRV